MFQVRFHGRGGQGGMTSLPQHPADMDEPQRKAA